MNQARGDRQWPVAVISMFSMLNTYFDTPNLN